MLTALSEYAREGINGVTLRRISSEAGCANTAAVHYHFGDRTGLLLAIVDFLDGAIWRPGYQHLKDTIQKNSSLREIIEAGLKPYKYTLFDFPWGADAQTFLFRLGQSDDNEAHIAFDQVRKKHDALFKKTVKASLPSLSKAVFEQRWQFMMTEAVAGQWARGRVLRTGTEATTKWTSKRERLYLERFLDYVVGGLQAP